MRFCHRKRCRSYLVVQGSSTLHLTLYMLMFCRNRNFRMRFIPFFRQYCQPLLMIKMEV